MIKQNKGLIDLLSGWCWWKDECKTVYSNHSSIGSVCMANFDTPNTIWMLWMIYWCWSWSEVAEYIDNTNSLETYRRPGNTNWRFQKKSVDIFLFSEILWHLTPPLWRTLISAEYRNQQTQTGTVTYTKHWTLNSVQQKIEDSCWWCCWWCWWWWWLDEPTQTLFGVIAF